jgi:outer membrane protein OmpA-like peptidoglycan-associated protein
MFGSRPKVATFVVIAALALAISGEGHAQDATGQTRCGIGWRPAFTFENSSKIPARDVRLLMADIIRVARTCRFGSLHIVVYPDTDSAVSLKLAHERASSIGKSLAGPGWPEEKITSSIASAADAPTGKQFGKSFRVQATIEFVQPDLSWKAPPPSNVLQCKIVAEKSICIPASPQSAYWTREPSPFVLSEPRVIFFDSGSSQLDSDGQKAIAEMVAIFRAENYRVIWIAGFSDTVETDPVELSLRRGQSVRSEFVKDGIDPSAIEIRALGDTNPLIPTGPGVEEPQNRRASFGCAD